MLWLGPILLLLGLFFATLAVWASSPDTMPEWAGCAAACLLLGLIYTSIDVLLYTDHYPGLLSTKLHYFGGHMFDEAKALLESLKKEFKVETILAFIDRHFVALFLLLIYIVWSHRGSKR